MKIRADLTKCQGHGLCRMSSPEVFDADDEGQVIVNFDGDIPTELEDGAALGVESCPELALEVVED